MTQEKPQRENLLKRAFLFIFSSQTKIQIYSRKNTNLSLPKSASKTGANQPKICCCTEQH